MGSTYSTYKKMNKKHKDFLSLLEKNGGLVYATCKKFNIHASTFYNWKKSIEGFSEKVEEINEGLLDLVESKLIQNIQNNDSSSIMFYLKCKAKHRGYLEKQQVEHSGNIGNKDYKDMTEEELKELAKERGIKI